MFGDLFCLHKTKVYYPGAPHGKNVTYLSKKKEYILFEKEILLELMCFWIIDVNLKTSVNTRVALLVNIGVM